MKKITCVLITCLFSLPHLFSQQLPPAKLVINAGPAVATGKFAGSDVSDDQAGLGKTGISLSASFSKPVTEYLLIVAQVQVQQNALNTGALEAYFEKYVGYPNWHFDKNHWQYGALLAGVESQLPLGNAGKIFLVTRLMAGVARIGSPELSGTSITTNTGGYLQQGKKSATGFIMNATAGFDFPLNKKVFLNTSLAFNGTNRVTFKDVQTTLTTTQGSFGQPDFAAQQVMNTTNGKQSISSMSLLVGIGIHL